MYARNYYIDIYIFAHRYLFDEERRATCELCKVRSTVKRIVDNCRRHVTNRQQSSVKTALRENLKDDESNQKPLRCSKYTKLYDKFEETVNLTLRSLIANTR